MSSPLLPTYARADLSFEKGEGPWLFGRDGERYLDFGAGIAVNALGHAHPHLVAALTEQAGKVWHTSNLFRIPEGEWLAERLVAATFADVVFFANSGAKTKSPIWVRYWKVARMLDWAADARIAVAVWRLRRSLTA